MEKVRDRAFDIERVVARLQTMTDCVVGKRNSRLYSPRNIEELQYSLPAQMALAVMGEGNGYATHRRFLDGLIDMSAESDIMQFARRIELEVSDELDTAYRFFVADITVYFKDGTSSHHFQERSKGSPGTPLTEAEFQGKLFELTDRVIDRTQATELFGLVDGLGPETAVADITRLLQPLNRTAV